jgi:hypothetical protein
VHLYAQHPELLENRSCTCVMSDEGKIACGFCLVRAAVAVRSVVEANRPVRDGDPWSSDLTTPTTSAPFATRHAVDEALAEGTRW